MTAIYLKFNFDLLPQNAKLQVMSLHGMMRTVPNHLSSFILTQNLTLIAPRHVDLFLFYDCHPNFDILQNIFWKKGCLVKLKHKDSFGKSENLSKIFFAEILVFDHDYEGKSSSSNGLLWISFIFFNNLFELFFELFGGPPNKSTHVINYTLQGVIIIKSLI